jgi:ubiquinone/menaquinone biosynthesis C-methylase UbiE
VFYGEIPVVQRVLALGDGDGRALSALLAAVPHAYVDYVDSSAKMLKLARARAGCDRVNYRCADARVVALGDSAYDLIVTHFFFDCFPDAELEAMVKKTARSAAPSARWIVSEFRPVNRYARMLIALMYAFFHGATGLATRRLADHRPHLLREGFRLERVEEAWAGMLASELWVR